MKRIPFLGLLFISFSFLTFSCISDNQDDNKIQKGDISISKTKLTNKIMGGWAGQVIGCTYGGPTEFQYKGTMINDYTPIKWDENRMLWYYENAPGLYDDIYMDLTFVDVFNKEGLDAPAESHAKAFANAEYKLWHANQAARYNILNGIMPPMSGYWTNNPHSDDIDFQIEADFAGLMSPGMINSATQICDKVGHIMNYGDGWYGGVFVAAMYSLSFLSDDINQVVHEALKTIPEESDFNKCITDVLTWYEKYPNDWKKTWFECQKKWSEDIGCPDGVFSAFDIDAKINSAYIVIGLLYGGGDFGKTLEISTRCGQDSDCNPASAGGIIGTLLGYDNIPAYWKQGLDKVENLDFKYTTISLNDVYKMSVNQAFGMIQRNGGIVDSDSVKILIQTPEAVQLEHGFKHHYPKQSIEIQKYLDIDNPEYSLDFEGKAFVLRGQAMKNDKDLKDIDLFIDVFIDNQLFETAKLPVSFQTRRHELSWKYEMENTKHNLKIVLKNVPKDYRVWMENCIIYGDK